MDRVPGILAFIIIVAGACWIYVAPPGFASPLPWTIGALLVLGLIAACRERLAYLLILLLTVVFGPALLALLIGLSNNLRLDAATSVAEGKWSRNIDKNIGRPLVIHLSDTHFVDSKGGDRTRQGDKWDAQVLTRVKKRILQLQPRYLILSGDVTDTGQEGAWDRAENEFLIPISRAGITIVMAPGNHDLQPFFSERPAWQLGGPQLYRFLREASNYGLDVQTAAHSSFAKVMSWKPPPDAEQLLERYNNTLNDCENKNCGVGVDGPPAQVKTCFAICRSTAAEVTKGRGPLSYEAYTKDACTKWYPMTRYDADEHVAFIVLCSVSNVARSVGTNAIGELGDEQVKAFHAALIAIPLDARQIFVVLHHPVVKRENDRFGLPTRLTKEALLSSSAFEFATLPNLVSEAHEIVAALRDAASSRPNAALFLIFGHRHGCFLGKLSQTNGKGPWVGVSEAPAAFDPLSGGMRIGYATESAAIAWTWWGNADSGEPQPRSDCDPPPDVPT